MKNNIKLFSLLIFILIISFLTLTPTQPDKKYSKCESEITSDSFLRGRLGYYPCSIKKIDDYNLIVKTWDKKSKFSGPTYYSTYAINCINSSAKPISRKSNLIEEFEIKNYAPMDELLKDEDKIYKKPSNTIFIELIEHLCSTY